MFRHYRICSHSIRIEAPMFSSDSQDWQKFETAECEPDISIECRLCGELPPCGEQSRGRAGEISVSSGSSRVYRTFQLADGSGAMTCYNPDDTSKSITYFTEDCFSVLTDERYFWHSVSLAQLMLPKKTVFLHSSFIEYNGKAILFTGQCGVGKSTQAELWSRFANALTVNGDKAGVSVRNGSVYADGLPFCGTSGICLNRSLPLGAVVVLGQASVNRVERLGGVEALQEFMKNIYLDLLAPGENGRCVDLTAQILASVPVYRLECVPNETAVIALKEELERGGVV